MRIKEYVQLSQVWQVCIYTNVYTSQNKALRGLWYPFLQLASLPPSLRKDAMLRYAQTMDLTQVYEESFRRLFEALRQVDKDEEYKEFVKDNKK